MGKFIFKDTKVSNEEIGTYGLMPKVIMQGNKYKNALDSDEKLIYMTMLQYAQKALHKGQVDDIGRVYVKLSHSMLHALTGIGEPSLKRKLKTSDESLPLFSLGLISFKGIGENKENCYYVMLPDFEDEDEIFKTSEKPTPKTKQQMDDKIQKKKEVRKAYEQKQKDNPKPISVAYVQKIEDMPYYEKGLMPNGQSIDDFEATRLRMLYLKAQMRSIGDVTSQLQISRKQKEEYITQLKQLSFELLGSGRSTQSATSKELDKLEEIFSKALMMIERWAKETNQILLNDKKTVIEVKYY